MKNFAGFALSALVGLGMVAAAPVADKREMVTEMTVVVVTKTVYETIHLTPGESAPTDVPAANAPKPKPAKSHPATTEAPHSAAPQPVASEAPASAPKASAPAPAASAPVASAPPSPPAASGAAAPVPSSAAAPAPAPAPSSAAAPAPVPSSAAAPAPASTSASSGSSSSGGTTLPGYGSTLPGASNSYQCTSSSPCGTPQASNAEASFYSMDVAGVQGLGSCGAYHNSESEDFVAIDATIMGSLSSGTPMNPLCGKTVTVKNTQNGKTATGTVVDTCPGCKSDWGIDLSEHLFDQMADESQGVFPVEWWFNDL